MATRIQVRRGTTSQWNTANPTLEEGEIGYNTTLGQMKIGDGTSVWADLDYIVNSASLDTSLGSYIPDSEKSAVNGVAELDGSKNILAPAGIVFEGTANDHETTLAVTDPTADRTITLPNVSGTVITTGNLSDITNIGVFTSTIVMEGSTANDFELTLSAGDPTADRTITFPDATGTVALTTDIAAGTVTETGTQTLTNKSISLGSNTVTSTLAQLNTAISDADVASLAGTETLTNKTLTTPTINGGEITNTGGTPRIHGIFLPETHFITFEGTTNNEFETVLTAGDPTADRTITLPDATGTVALAADVAALSGATFTGAVSGTDLTLSGNLTVNGTTTNINSTNLVVEDKNIVLADVATPTDTTADGGGITLKGATDKTFNWVDATDSWTSSEHINLASGKTLKYNGTDLVAAQSGNSGKYLTTDGTSTSWAVVAAGVDEAMIFMGAY